jgi:hypothetical protein
LAHGSYLLLYDAASSFVAFRAEMILMVASGSR